MNTGKSNEVLEFKGRKKLVEHTTEHHDHNQMKHSFLKLRSSQLNPEISKLSEATLRFGDASVNEMAQSHDFDEFDNDFKSLDKQSIKREVNQSKFLVNSQDRFDHS
mmetsp:Transcript_33549/g.38537  ORF Transcript_33549/g.38537 Transcript_33549/m.38537 type:complete len:107 (-) Transcript_33549:9-329(-)